MQNKSFFPLFPLRRADLLPAGSMAVNLIVYYGAKLINRGRPHYSLTLPADSAFPFLPWTVAIYGGFFLLWALTFMYAARREDARTYQLFCADLLGKLVCFLFFVFLPTTTARPIPDGGGLWDMLTAMVYVLDTPTNLFPSIHCMVSWLCFIDIRGDRAVPRWVRAAVGLAALAVCVSTLTTRQHVLADAASGILLAEAAWWAAGRAVEYFQQQDTELSRFLRRTLKF